MSVEHNVAAAIRSIKRGKLFVSRFDKDIPGDGEASSHTRADIKNVLNAIDQLWADLDDFAFTIMPYKRLHPFNNLYSTKNPDALVYKTMRIQFFKTRKLSEKQYKWLVHIHVRCEDKVKNITSHPNEIAAINRMID